MIQTVSGDTTHFTKKRISGTSDQDIEDNIERLIASEKGKGTR